MADDREPESTWDEQAPLLAEVIMFVVTAAWGGLVWARERLRGHAEVGTLSNEQIDRMESEDVATR